MVHLTVVPILPACSGFNFICRLVPWRSLTQRRSRNRDASNGQPRAKENGGVDPREVTLADPRHRWLITLRYLSAGYNKTDVITVHASLAAAGTMPTSQ